ncbi:TadE/TadG family type IV pilus assembly protein [Thomasclavelia saccharogumia]|uniref:TadE/TadG family type IV pilus assembly protein n=1 Tax=Thomasclavelia saccharogumia TaxID=341225 RepID=UPI0004788201|nr:TadE family protein [Thomasclavelia saccharogumia]
MKTRRELGSVTIEATIALTMFMFAFLGITSLSTLVRAESKVQYALNQTAKELSQYMYIFYRADNTGDTTKPVDDLIRETGEFTNMIKNASKDIESSGESFSKDQVTADLLNTINDVKDDVQNILEAGKSLANRYKSVAENPTEVLNAIYSIIKGEVKNIVRSKVIAPVVANILMPKYLETGEKSADEFLEDMGVTNGMSGLNFSLSSIMEDGRTINLTVVYTVDYKIPLIGDRQFVFKQTASTAAWSKETKLTEIKSSIWDKPPLKRGKEIVENIKKENAALAVNTNKTYGFDLYDKNTNTFTQIISINTQDPSYVLNSEGNGISLNEANFKKQIKKEASSLNEYMQKTETVNMENGSVLNVDAKGKNGVIQIYIPKDSNLKETAQKYANEVAKEYDGITIKVSYYEE